MTQQDRLTSDDQQAPTDQHPSTPRELTTDELRAIVGGPEIQNGGTPPG